jgi:prepilin-type N-terminal cleavage/methylation domain-containing protein
MRAQTTRSHGFTLIELSIVLVIIGLIVGGILVGQSLINAATLRATISQIEKYQTATNTFREKYNYLPGDITPQAVTQFGFTASPTRAGTAGEGDGNGEIDGGNASGAFSWAATGEERFFWVDLSTNSHLIEGGFNAASSSPADLDCESNGGPTRPCNVYFPYAKIGNGSFIYAYSGYAANCCASDTGFGPNCFGLSIINSTANQGNIGDGAIPPAPALTAAQAAAIDTKIDDGLPTTGNVLAQYLGGRVDWSTHGSSPSASTCYDTSTGNAAYSITYQNGSNVTCSISFKFQAGD